MSDILISICVGVVIFQAVWWIGNVWILGAKVLDEHPE